MDDLDIRPGDIYEDCAYHPVLCMTIDVAEDDITGISLTDGSQPRSCWLKHCGVIKLTIDDVAMIKADHPAYVARMLAESEGDTEHPSS